MKVYISYFYQIRNFNKYMIPLSTAMFDPKGYHDNKEITNLFWDKNGVINGLRCYHFIFNKDRYQGWCSDECCFKARKRELKKSDTKDLVGCPYLDAYKRMLSMTSWTDVIQFFKSAITYVANHNNDLDNIDKYNVCLIVYETPSEVCSEREELINWFKAQGIDLIEWNKDVK